MPCHCSSNRCKDSHSRNRSRSRSYRTRSRSRTHSDNRGDARKSLNQSFASSSNRRDSRSSRQTHHRHYWNESNRTRNQWNDRNSRSRENHSERNESKSSSNRVSPPRQSSSLSSNSDSASATDFFKRIYLMTGKKLHPETCLRLDCLIKQKKLLFSDLEKPVFVNSMQFLNEQNISKFDQITNDSSLLTRTGQLDIFQVTKLLTEEFILSQGSMLKLIPQMESSAQNLPPKIELTNVGKSKETENKTKTELKHKPKSIEMPTFDSSSTQNEVYVSNCELEIHTPDAEIASINLDELLEQRGYAIKHVGEVCEITRKEFIPFVYDNRFYGIKLKNTDYGKTVSVKGVPSKEGIELELLTLFEKYGQVDQMCFTNNGRMSLMMSNREAVRKVIKNLNGYKILPNQELLVREPMSKIRLYVINLPFEMTESVLKDKLLPHIDGIRVFEIKSTYYNQKFCWIDFINSDMASEGKRKLEKYGDKWLGRDLKVEWALITTVLCARDFDSTVSVEKLGEVFGEFGPLANITKKRLDFALIEFESSIDAYMARDELNLTKLDRKKMFVWPAAKLDDLDVKLISMASLNKDENNKYEKSNNTSKSEEKSTCQCQCKANTNEESTREPLGNITNKAAASSSSESSMLKRGESSQNMKDLPLKKRRY